MKAQLCSAIVKVSPNWNLDQVKQKADTSKLRHWRVKYHVDSSNRSLSSLFSLASIGKLHSPNLNLLKSIPFCNCKLLLHFLEQPAVIVVFLGLVDFILAKLLQSQWTVEFLFELRYIEYFYVNYTWSCCCAVYHFVDFALLSENVISYAMWSYFTE